MSGVAVRSERLDIISICTGGGGLDLGVELAIPSARSVVLVEREAFAAAQLVSAMEAGLMAPAPLWSDARTFNGRAWRGAVDGLIGGIPCQPHSLAGKRLGREDPRDLWSTARRIIVQSGAWFVLIENVEGMLSSGGAERVYRDLGRLGFACEVGLFTAAEVGASHQRGRTFILGVADARCFGGAGWGVAANMAGPPGVRQGDGAERQRHGHASLDGSDDAADPGDPRLQGRERGGPSGERHRAEAPRSVAKLRPASLGNANVIREFQPHNADGAVPRGEPRHRAGGSGVGLFPPGPGDLDGWRRTLDRAPELEPAFRRVADGLASRLDIARVDRLRLLGNGVVPLQAAHAIRTLSYRLAQRGPTGAARLVRMMEAA